MNECKITVQDINNVNTAISNGSSLNKLDKTSTLCGLSRKAFKSNALKLAYEFKDNAFIFNPDIKADAPRASSRVLITEQKSKEPKPVAPVDNDYKALERRIEILESIINKQSSDFIVDDRIKDCEIISRSFKASQSALDAFNDVCEDKLSVYTKQTLLSQALLEFADKYK